jgi:hypothetical protein
VYEAAPLPIAINLFVAAEKPEHAEYLGGEYYGWEQLYRRERIRVRKVPGTHDAMVSTHARDLAKAMSESFDGDRIAVL